MRITLIVVVAACTPVMPEASVPADVPSDSGPVAVSTNDTAPPPAPAFDGLPRDSWTYVDVQGMHCGSGVGTGIGVNPGRDPSKLVILVQGGGACWDYWTCYELGMATHVLTGWGEGQMAAESAFIEANLWLLDRDDEANEWAEATFALIPYCTGDQHLGRSIQSYNDFDPTRQLHHVGNTNMTFT